LKPSSHALSLDAINHPEPSTNSISMPISNAICDADTINEILFASFPSQAPASCETSH